MHDNFKPLFEWDSTLQVPNREAVWWIAGQIIALVTTSVVIGAALAVMRATGG